MSETQDQPSHPDVLIYLGGELFQIELAEGVDREAFVAALTADLNSTIASNSSGENA